MLVVKRLGFVLFGGMLLGGGAIAQAETNPGKAKHKNLLFITFDTTRADRLGCYGFEGVDTAAIDRLAREGTLFTRAYAQVPQTMPSHTSLFTGLYPVTHNVVSNGQALSDEALTLAEILRAAGYRTGAIVAAAPLMQDYNLNQGFDYYNDDFDEHAVVGGFKAFIRLFSARRLNIPTSRGAHRVTALAKQWLSQRAKGRKPFFLWVHYFDPHHPYEFHPDFDQPALVVDEGEVNEYGYKEANYINEIAFASYSLGKLLDHLDKLGLADETLTVFAGDHGESLGEHGYRGHREDVYENIIRIPLILRFPGRLPAGQRVDSAAMSIDVLPTILSLLDIPYFPNTFQGKNLFAPETEEPRKIYALAVKLFTRSPIRRSMIFGDLKFIEFEDPERNALFNLRADPDEMVNLLKTDHPAAEDVAWQAEIQSWFERHENLQFADYRLTKEQLERLRSLGYVQ